MKGQEFLKSCIKNAAFTPIHLENKELTFMEVNERMNTVKCIIRNSNDGEPFSVRTSTPLQENQCAGYFEVTITNMTREQGIAIGLCRKDCSIKKPPGISKWSIGLQSSGHVFSDKVKVATLSPFSKGDTIGCGIIYDTLQVFFTKNGTHQQKPPTKLHQSFTQYYPTASLHCQSQQLQFNFGEKPFRFDFTNYLSKLRTQRTQHISSHYKVDVVNLYDLVEDYLYFHGYCETLEKFQKIRAPKDELKEKYLLADAVAKVVGFDFREENMGGIEQQEEEEHKTEKEDQEWIMEEDGMRSPPTLRQRFMSQTMMGNDPFPSLQLGQRKESYDANWQRLIKRKESVPSGEDLSLMMEVEDQIVKPQTTEKQNKEMKPYGPLTKKFLDEDRVKILKLARNLEIEACIEEINRTIPKLLTVSKLLPYFLNGHIYLKMIKQGKNYEAIDFARQKKLDNFRTQPFPKYQPTKGQVINIKFQDMISAIIFRQSYEKSLLSQQQFYTLAEIINGQIMKYLGLYDKSKLELMLAQIKCVEQRYEKEKHSGDRICLFN